MKQLHFHLNMMKGLSIPALLLIYYLPNMV